MVAERKICKTRRNDLKNEEKGRKGRTSGAFEDVWGNQEGAGAA